MVAMKPTQVRPPSIGTCPIPVTRQVCDAWPDKAPTATHTDSQREMYRENLSHCFTAIRVFSSAEILLSMLWKLGHQPNWTVSWHNAVSYSPVGRGMAEGANTAGGRDSAPPDVADSFPTEEHECKICYNYFDLDRHTPKLLGCSHTFCQECLDALHSREDRGWRIGCPVCRHRTPVPEYRIHNLPDNTALTEALRLKKPECVNSSNTNDQTGPPVSSAATQDSSGSCQLTCTKVAFTTGCVCAIFCFLSTAVLLLLGLVFVHNFKNTTWPVGPVCLFVASVLAMFSLILTWLLCMVKLRPETQASDFSSLTSNVMWPVTCGYRAIGHTNLSWSV